MLGSTPTVSVCCRADSPAGAHKWDQTDVQYKTPGRPRIRQVVVDVISASRARIPPGDRIEFKAHWDDLAAVDFTTVEAWTENGPVTYYLLFAMELAIRRVHFDRERNHHRLDNTILEPSEKIGQDAGDIEGQERLGGMLRYYYRVAA